MRFFWCWFVLFFGICWAESDWRSLLSVLCFVLLFGRVMLSFVNVCACVYGVWFPYDPMQRVKIMMMGSFFNNLLVLAFSLMFYVAVDMKILIGSFLCYICMGSVWFSLGQGMQVDPLLGVEMVIWKIHILNQWCTWRSCLLEVYI